jgi:hypothetical protein
MVVANKASLPLFDKARREMAATTHINGLPGKY